MDFPPIFTHFHREDRRDGPSYLPFEEIYECRTSSKVLLEILFTRIDRE